MVKLSKDKCIELILEQINIGSPYKETFKVIQSKTKLVESTFASYWKIANNQYQESQIKLNKAKEDKTISEELKGVESGVKIKIQRVLELQKQIESLELELEKDIMVVHTFSDGEIIVRERKLNALEKASLHKTIKEIRAEISKIEGDYAPIKNDMNLKGFTPQKIIFK